jgi:glycosyltransferase involved in cell wall biosynthesis
LNDLFIKARNLRLIKGDFPSHPTIDLTVFIGVYNGKSYIPKIIEQLTSQLDQNFLIVVADNNSQDSSWEDLQKMLRLFPNRIKIVKNPINFGAAGSLALSMDLIESEWWCGFHQDDDYKSNYVKNFNQLIQHAKRNIVSISAEMGAITHAGTKAAVPARSSWLLKKPDLHAAFIANLRVQTIPYPATAFRTSIFRECVSPWHSTAFSDTESTLAMLEFGNFQFSSRHTMNYRENEMSESHSINNHESLLATGSSLARVFSSTAFAGIAKQVDAQDRINFLEALNKSIEIRLGISELSKFVKYIAAENCMVAWDYSETSSIEQVRSYFVNTESAFTPQLLNRILDFLNMPSNKVGDVSFSTQHFLNSFLGSPNLNVNLRNQNLSSSRRFYNVIMKFMPHFLQKRIGRSLLKLRILLNPTHPWNFKWK